MCSFINSFIKAISIAPLQSTIQRR